MNQKSKFTGKIKLPKSLEPLKNIKFLSIILEDIKRMVATKKFKAMAVVMFLPVVISLIVALSFQPLEFGARAAEEAFEENAGTWISSYWIAWLSPQTGDYALIAILPQILTILIASEFVAGEYEHETLRLLLIKPIKRSEIIFGKLLAFIVCICAITVLPLFFHATLVCLRYGGGIEGLTNILTKSFLYGEAIILLGLVSMASFTTMFSSLFKRSLYAALVALMASFSSQLIVPPLFAPLLGSLVEANKYTVGYQLGVILEEGFYLGEGNLYSGDPLMSFTVIYVLNVVFLVVSLLALYRREMP